MVRNKVLTGAVSVLLGMLAPVAAEADTAGTQSGHTASTAAAEPGGWCPDGNICFYSEPFFHGEQEEVEPVYEHFCGEVEVAPARSVINNSYETWTLYDQPGCDGRGVDIEPGQTLEFAPRGVHSWY